nr:twitching motility protein PilT [Actinomycetota bacterium]
MTRLTYDTGALIAAARGDRRMWALHRRMLERGRPPTVPAAALVEAWRGEVDMARALEGCVIEPLDEANARAAGRLLARCAVAVETT